MGAWQCSFCGKGQGQVTKLIAGPGVYICDECIDLCQEILAEERDGAEPPLPKDVPPDGPAEALSSDMSAESLDQFLKDVGRVRLLTAQEEVDLAKRIERGEPDAKQTMVKANLRLVVSIAKDYRHQGLSFLAVIRAGTLGLPRRRELRLPQGPPLLKLREPGDPPVDRPRAPRPKRIDPLSAPTRPSRMPMRRFRRKREDAARLPSTFIDRSRRVSRSLYPRAISRQHESRTLWST